MNTIHYNDALLTESSECSSVRTKQQQKQQLKIEESFFFLLKKLSYSNYDSEHLYGIIPDVSFVVSSKSSQIDTFLRFRTSDTIS